MPTDYVSFDNIAVAPTPPGVFATSMPSEFSSEDYLSVSNMQLHNSSLMGGSAYPKSISSSPKYLSITPRTTKSSDYSMTKKEDFISNKGKNKKSEKNELLHPKKSGVELFRNSRIRSSPPCSENVTPSQENKSLKVTIRRNSDFSNLDNHHAHKVEKRDMDCKSEAGGVDDLSNITSIFRSPESYPCSRTIKSIANKIEPDLEISSKISSYNKQDELPKTSNFDKQLGTEPCSSKDVSTNTETDCATTELDSRLQCEPGSKVVLEGVVWLETPGMVVINAHWRGRTYLGTLLDSSKKTLSSSCPDKMISALSLVQRRRNRNVGKNHRKRSCTCISKLPIHNIGNSETSSLNSRLSGNGCCGAAMTTRSAAAAAAAASERLGSDMEKNNDRASEIYFCKRRYVSSTKQRRGATKRKSRSGLSFGSESGNVCTKSTTLRNIKSRRKNPHHLLTGTTTSLAVSKRNKSICRKLQHGDEDENQKLTTANNLDTMDIIFSHSERLRGAEIDERLDSGDAITSMNSVHLNKPEISSISKEITITKQVEDSANKIELPPCLAMAKHDITYLAPCADDDDQPPPKLDRGPGTEDELVGMVNHMKPDLIEPPTASPAYSDISDDAETDKNLSSRLSHQSLHSNMSWNSSERRNRFDSSNSQKIALHVRKKHSKRKNLPNPSISNFLFNDHTGSRELKTATSSWKFSPHNHINNSSLTNQGTFVPQIVNSRSSGIFRLDECNDSAYIHNLPTFLSERLDHLSDTDVLSSKPTSSRNNSSFSTTELLSLHPRATQLPTDFDHHDEYQDDTNRISKKMKSAADSLT